MGPARRCIRPDVSGKGVKQPHSRPGGAVRCEYTPGGVSVQSRLHRIPADPGLPRDGPGARPFDGVHVWRQRPHGRLQRRFPHSQPVSPPVCRGCICASLCARAGNHQNQRRRGGHAPADRCGGHRPGLDAAVDLHAGCAGRASAGVGPGQRHAPNPRGF